MTGNFIILDINIQDYRMTLVAIYGPNEDNSDFFKKLVFNINQFDNSSVIIAGDWNVVQDYRVDTVNYIGENNPKSKLVFLFVWYCVSTKIDISYISLHLLKISQRFTLFDSLLQLIDPMTTAYIY
jgi:hypothetical protein